MSVLAAVVSFDDDGAPLGDDWDVAAPILRLPVSSVQVQAPPGGLLGFGSIAADSWRRRDEQPLVDGARQVAVVADCRLDNRDELRATLSLGRESTDARLLLGAYDRWGVEMASHLVGDFAVVIWDWRRQQLVALRDHFGAKPVYYWIGERKFVVTTDIGVLIDLVEPSRVPDDQFIVEHLLMQYRSTDRTFWGQIKRLPGGHQLVARRGRCDLARYWFPPAGEIKRRSTEEVHEDLRELFFAAVERRLDSETPIVAHLSGGMDSSSIVCVANEIYKRTGSRPLFVAASSLYPGLECDESEFIKAVVDQVAFEAEAWDGRSEGMSPLLAPSLLGPGMGADPAGDMKVGRRIGAKVLLNGFGGDHLFASDGVLEDLARSRSAGVALGRLLGPGVSLRMRATRSRYLLRRLAPLQLRRIIGKVRGRRTAPVWLADEWRGLAGDLAAAGYPHPAHAKMSNVKGRHWEAIGSGSLGLALDSEQQRATASGLEVRYPFLDLKLVEYALTIPFEHWPPVASYARLHREFLAAHLPQAVLRRPKATFSVGVAHRMKLAWPLLRSLFLEGEWHSARYVNRLSAQALIVRGEQSTDGNDWALWRGIWGIGMLEAWLRRISGYCTVPKRRP